MTAFTGLYVHEDGDLNGTLAQGGRLAVGGLLTGDGGNPLDVRTGVLVDAGGPVVSGTGAWEYEIRPLRAVTKTADSNGPVVLSSNDVVIVTTDPAPGANSRIDTIWVRQHHVAGDGDADTDVEVEFGVTVGAPGAIPVKPAAPAGATVLGWATLTSADDDTSTAEFERGPWTVTNGGRLPVTAAERDALTPWDGFAIFNEDTGRRQFWDGSAWVNEADDSDSGWTAITLNGGFVVDNGETPARRKIGGIVYLVGRVKRSPAANFVANTPYDIATLPVGYRPDSYRRHIAIASGNTVTELKIATTGVMQIVTDANTAWVSIAVPAYPAS